MDAYIHGEDWRWNTAYHATPKQTSISVIEKPSLSYEEYHEKKNKQKGAKRVPFGFSRALKDD